VRFAVLTCAFLLLKIKKMAKLNVGKTLQEARLSKGIILEEVEKATHVRLNYLEAIEENRFQEIPASAYLRAYVRKYAEFLGLDPAPLLECLETAATASYRLELPGVLQREKFFYRRRNPLRSFLLIVGIGLALFLFALFLVNLIVPPAGPENTGSTIASLSSPTGSPPITASPTGQTSTTTAPPSPSSPSPSQPLGEMVQFQVQALDKGNLEVEIEGRVQFSGELNPGQMGTWRGRNFTLRFDNPQNFKLFVEGEEIPLTAENTFQWPQPQ